MRRKFSNLFDNWSLGFGSVALDGSPALGRFFKKGDAPAGTGKGDPKADDKGDGEADDKSEEDEDAKGDGEADDKGDGEADDKDDADPKAWKERHDAAEARAAEAEKKARSMRKKLKDLEANMPSREELEAFRNERVKRQKEEQDRKKKAGDFESLLASEQEKHTKEKNDLAVALAEKDRKLADARVSSELAAHIPKYTSVQTQDVVDLIRPRLHFDIETDTIVVLKAKSTDPEDPELDPKTGKPMSVEQFVAKFIDERPAFKAFQPKGGSGGGSQKGSGGGKGGVYNVEDLESMDQETYRQKRAEIKKSIGMKS